MKITKALKMMTPKQAKAHLAKCHAAADKRADAYAATYVSPKKTPTATEAVLTVSFPPANKRKAPVQCFLNLLGPFDYGTFVLMSEKDARMLLNLVRRDPEQYKSHTNTEFITEKGSKFIMLLTTANLIDRVSNYFVNHCVSVNGVSVKHLTKSV